jgi:hypothetical protein
MRNAGRTSKCPGFLISDRVFSNENKTDNEQPGNINKTCKA